jgi:signal transduction histidine kinase
VTVAAAAASPAAHAGTGGVLRILLLEDSDPDAKLLESRLEDAGLAFELTRVQTHADFNDAVARCRFDLILSDYNVPGFDGLSALAASHLGCPDVPFIFVTGALGEERAIELLKKGATDYVLKDRLERLVPSLDRALREANEKAERKRAEEELRARAEFEAQLVGIVSHDLRNPLQAITISAAMLVRQENLDERSSKGVRRILSAAERATRMIHDLLDFTQARLGGGIPVAVEPIELRQPVAAVVEELRHTHPERELRLEAGEDTSVIADPGRVGQVVANLVGNALKYSAAGSPVTVRISAVADELLLEVHNRGTPILPEQQERLFKPLSRLQSKVDLQTRSIGLGLYIVDSIARAHHGRVEVRSTQEEGTTFTVRLPRA